MKNTNWFILAVVIIGLIFCKTILFIADHIQNKQSPSEDLMGIEHNKDWFRVNTNLYPTCDDVQAWKYFYIITDDELKCKITNPTAPCWIPIVKTDDDFILNKDFCNFSEEDLVFVYWK